MPVALTITDLTNAVIDTVRSANNDGYQFIFKSTDDSVNYGHVFDKLNTFVDGSTSGSPKALKVEITSGSTNRAVQDMDFVTLTATGSLKIWFPVITGSGTTTLYVDTDGNTWTDSALTTPAGGVGSISDAGTISETELDATDFLDDPSTAATDAIDSVLILTSNLSDESSSGDSITEFLNSLTTYLSDSGRSSDLLRALYKRMTTYLNDLCFGSDCIQESLALSGAFTEEPQTDLLWSEE